MRPPLAMATASVRNPASEGGRWAALSVICLGIFMIFLDTTTVNVAVPNLIDGIHASLDQVLWVLNAYLLTYGALLLTSGRLGDMLGQRRVYVAGVGVFTLASVLCGLSQDGVQLVVARVLQGLGAALLTPQCLVMISRIFPAERRGPAMGVFAATGGLAAMAGPLAGGLIITAAGWRWVFYLNVPVGIATIVLTFLFVPAFEPGGPRRMDLAGVALATAGLFAIMFGLIEQDRLSSTAVGPVGVLACGLALLAVFVVVERGRPEPLLPRGLFRNRNLMVMAGLSGVMAFALFGMLLVVIVDLQSVIGMSPLQAGLTASPLTIATTLVSPLAGRLSDRVGSRRVLVAGFTVAAAGVIDLAVVERATATWADFLLPATIVGAGLGFVFAPLLTEALRDVPAEILGSAAGLLTTTRQVGSALGAAVVGAVLQNRLTAAFHHGAGLYLGPAQMRSAAVPAALANAYVTAMRPSLAVVAGALLLGAFTCRWIRRSQEDLRP
jgi:EmrB/QacA subfamily drug resistance transporter